jgi:hypothetical protein
MPKRQHAGCKQSRAGSGTAAFAAAESEGDEPRPRLCCPMYWVPASAGMTFVATDALSTGVIPAEAGT